MKIFNCPILALITLLTVTSGPLKAQEVAPDLFFGKMTLASPIPSDDDVIHTLGRATKKKLPPKTFKFLVWNLHKGEDETFKPEYLALSFDRDIILNQEIYLDQNMQDVFKLLPFFNFETATSFFYGKEDIRTGVANISPVEPTLVQYVRTQNLEPVLKSPKIALITRYPIAYSSKELTVVNIHGINFVSNKVFRQEIDRVYQAIKNMPRPLVFAGDFNTWNEERLAILEDYAHKLGLEEAGFAPDNRITFNGNFLDHFYYSSELKIKRARVDSKYKGSDHKPLQIEVEYIRSEKDYVNEDENSSETEQDTQASL